MKRRDFVRNVSVLGATAGLVRVAKPWAMASFQLDESDRSADRDPMTILHSSLVVEGLDTAATTKEYLKKLKAAGVNCRVQGGTKKRLEPFADTLVLATTVKEIRQAYKQNKIAQVFNMQSAPYFNELVSPLGTGRTRLPELYEEGLRICGLCYNLVCIYGGGCIEPHVGLTRAGRRLVEDMNRLGIVIDVGGHMGEKSSLDVIAISPDVPVIDTHTNVRALNDNPRCDSDRLIEAIAKTGGVIGITAYNDFMARNPKNTHLRRIPQVGIEKYLDQFDYVRKLVGVDHVGLGTDNVEGQDAPWKRQNWLAMPLEAYSENWDYVKGFESMSELPNVVRGLIKRGWSTGEIRKVLGENWLRVYKQVWGV